MGIAFVENFVKCTCVAKIPIWIFFLFMSPFSAVRDADTKAEFLLVKRKMHGQY